MGSVERSTRPNTNDIMSRRQFLTAGGALFLGGGIMTAVSGKAMADTGARIQQQLSREYPEDSFKSHMAEILASGQVRPFVPPVKCFTVERFPGVKQQECVSEGRRKDRLWWSSLAPLFEAGFAAGIFSSLVGVSVVAILAGEPPCDPNGDPSTTQKQDV